MEIDEKIRMVNNRLADLEDKKKALKRAKSRVTTGDKIREYSKSIESNNKLIDSNEKMLVMLYNFKETGTDLIH